MMVPNFRLDRRVLPDALLILIQDATLQNLILDIMGQKILLPETVMDFSRQ